MHFAGVLGCRGRFLLYSETTNLGCGMHLRGDAGLLDAGVLGFFDAGCRGRGDSGVGVKGCRDAWRWQGCADMQGTRVGGRPGRGQARA